MKKNGLLIKTKAILFTMILAFSCLLSCNILFYTSAGEKPIFGTVWDSNVTTDGNNILISVNITTHSGMETLSPTNASIKLNFTIHTSGGDDIHNKNWPVTNSTEENWTITIPASFIPVDGIQLEYNFTAVNTSDMAAGVGRLNNQTIDISDVTPPSAIGKVFTAEEPAHVPTIDVLVGTEVTLNGAESTDNIGVTSYTWTIPGLTPDPTGVEVSHTFTTAGAKIVTLNVTDAAGNWDTGTVTVNVQEIPILYENIDLYVAQMSEIMEDSGYNNISLEDNGNSTGYIFNYTGADAVSYTVFDADDNLPNGWGTSYDSDNFTGEIIHQDGIKIFQLMPKEDVYFPDGAVENISFKASNTVGDVIYNISFIIVGTNDAPLITTPDMNGTVTISEGSEQTIVVKAKDEKDPMDVLSLSTNISFEIPGLVTEVVNTTYDNITNEYTFKLNLTPSNDMVGDYPVSIMVTDDSGSASSDDPITSYNNITLLISNVNDAPIFDGFIMDEEEGDEDEGTILFNINEDQEINITITADDPDLIHGFEELSFDVEDSENLSFDEDENIEQVSPISANYTIKGLKDFNGIAWINVSLSDKTGLTIYKMIMITVKAKNDAPSIDDLSLTVNKTKYKEPTKDIPTYEYNFTLFHQGSKFNSTALKDIDGDTLTFQWYLAMEKNGTSAPNWNASKDGLKITQKLNPGKNYTIWIRVSDGNGGFDVKDLSRIKVPAWTPPKAKSDDGGGNLMLIIIIIVIVLVIVGVVVVLMMKKKGKKEPEDDLLAPVPDGVPCSNCGSNVPMDQPACPACGTPMMPPGQAGPSIFPCNVCGAMIQSGQPACGNCGTPVPPNQMQQQPAPGMDPYGQQPAPGMDPYGQQPAPGMDPYGQPPAPGMDPYGQQPPMQQQPQYGQQPPMQQQPPPQPGMGGGACPYCGTPVDPNWYLCPNCKNQL